MDTHSVKSPFLRDGTDEKSLGDRYENGRNQNKRDFCEGCSKLVPPNSRYCMYCGCQIGGSSKFPEKNRPSPPTSTPQLSRMVERRHSSVTLIRDDPEHRARVESFLLPYIEMNRRENRFEEQSRASAVKHWHEHSGINDGQYFMSDTSSRRLSDGSLSTFVSDKSNEDRQVVRLRPGAAGWTIQDIGGYVKRPMCSKTGAIFTKISSTFMGDAPNWYKYIIIAFLILNIILRFISPIVAGWVIVLEFIFTLMMAFKCYPLEPGGIIAIEVVILGLTTAEKVYEEISRNLEVILLLIFMVAATHFLKKLLLYVFSQVMLTFHSKIPLCLAFQFSAAILSAFLDALTVTAVLIHVIMGLYDIYAYRERQRSSMDDSEKSTKEIQKSLTKEEIQEQEDFICFLRELVMHSLLGTALGGGLTAVGEPQNLLIADLSDWGFVEYFLRVLPVSGIVFVTGLITNMLLEKFKIFGYGTALPQNVRKIIEDHKEKDILSMTDSDRAQLVVQGAVSIFVVIALGFQLAAVGVIGLAAIILVTTFNGIIEEEDIGKSFQDSLPFTALLCVFFAIVAMIDDLQLFHELIVFVVNFSDFHSEVLLFFLVTGLLSMISDNVFVATIYIFELYMVMTLNDGELPRDQYDLLAVSVNTGTNVLSVATPNGQAAFLFLLTSSLAPTLDLTYLRMVWMALPYTLTLTVAGIIGNYFLLEPMTDYFLDIGAIPFHEVPLPSAC